MKKAIKIGKVAGPYSPGILASGSKLIFVSGQVANNLEADIRTQTKEVITKIKTILAEEKAFLSDVVKTTVYLADIKDFSTVNEEYKEFFSEISPPARAALQAAALPLNARIMIEAIAIRE
jgi:2-iminobutanoate/2-iminopropanoate deaminase